MTIGNGNQITESDWVTAANASRADIDSVRSRQYIRDIPVALPGITSGTTGVVIFTPQDNLEVIGLRVWAAGGPATSQTVTLTLSVDSGDTRFLLGDTPSLTLTEPSTSAAVAHTDTTAKRYVLLKGVAYRITLSASATFTMARGAVQVRGGLRR